MNYCAEVERYNPFPGVDMNRGWQRLYYRTALTFFCMTENRTAREFLLREQEKRVEISESFSRFRWKRPSGPRMLETKWCCDFEKKFDVLFEGD